MYWRRRTQSIKRSLREINWKVNKIMATQQETLDAIVARIDAATAGIRADIADLKAANPEIDFTALEERVAGLEGLDAENPEAPPVEA